MNAEIKRFTENVVQLERRVLVPQDPQRCHGCRLSRIREDLVALRLELRRVIASKRDPA